jgi:hypothetical protein
MGNTKTSDEQRRHYIKLMGTEMGATFHALWQELASAHWRWSEFVALFGTGPETVEVLNRAAATLFRLVQDDWFCQTALHITRLTDRSAVCGRQNLTIQSLPNLIADPTKAKHVRALVNRALSATEFCRDWRNRHIAHCDLALAIEPRPPVPLESATQLKVDKALESIAQVLNAVLRCYDESTTIIFRPLFSMGARSLLCVLREGLAARDERRRARRTFS